LKKTKFIKIFPFFPQNQKTFPLAENFFFYIFIIDDDDSTKNFINMNKEKTRKPYPYPIGVQPYHSSFGYFAVGSPLFVHVLVSSTLLY
jgi:hypothetical protein